MAILPIGIGSEEASHRIERSLRFNSADSAYLSRTPASAGNRRTWTWSGWVKRSALSSSQFLFDATSGIGTRLYFSSGDAIQFDSGGSGVFTTSQVFRDVSSWYHIVFVADTTQATTSNRIKLYVNGSQVTAFSATSYPAQNTDTDWNNTVSHYLGRNGNASVSYLNGYLTEIHSIDGQALAPTSFGEYNSETGVWQPKAYTGSYGTNGFYLDFADNSSTTALGYDAAGSNDWTPNNFSVTAGAGNDSLVDTPTPYGTDTGAGGEVRGNYATWNPLDKDDGISSVTEGNLKVVTNGSNGSIKSTIAFPSGKWYWEVTSDSISGSGTQAIGIMPQSQPPTNNMSDSGKLGYAIDASFSDRKFENGTATSYGSYTQANGAVYMLAFDQDAGKLWYGVNGTWLTSGNPAAGTNPSSSSISTTTAYCAAVSDNTVSGTFTVNFGNRAFAYTAPSGFKALCTQNLPTPTIGATSTTQAGKYMNVALYTGNGSTQSITGVGFQPDFVWLKARSAAYGHGLFDVLRGTTKRLYSDGTGAEGTESGVTSFDSDGFTMGSATFGNNNGTTMVGWNWKANGAGSSNTQGSITSTVSANTTAGFSIVTYTGNATSSQTVGHGLGITPTFIIIKKRSASDTWNVYHAVGGITGNTILQLNTTDAAATGSNINITANSTTVGFGSASQVNGSGATFVCYAFAPVAGYSAFGSYTGNADTTGSGGPFIYLGFRPKWWMHKRTDASGDGWWVYDSVRNTYNPLNLLLLPNSTSVEITQTGTGIPMDFVSNGVKIRNTSTDGSINGNGATYIYAAFAENPFKYALAR